MVHRGFKNLLEKNVNHVSHIRAVELDLGRDWRARLYALYKYWDHGSEMERQLAERVLQRLLLGAVAFNVSHSIPDVRRIYEDFGERSTGIFKSPIIRYFESNKKDPCLLIKKQYWKEKCVVPNAEDKYLQHGDRRLRKLFDDISTFRTYKEARFLSVELFSVAAWTKSYSVVRK